MDATPLERAIHWYDSNAEERTEIYLSLDAAATNAWWADLLPPSPSCIVDIGAGSGRDAAWLDGMGHRVIAVEPSSGMRREALARQTSESIEWVDDGLPYLGVLQRRGIRADAVLASAVWMHMPSSVRPQAMRSLSSLLRPLGLLAMTVRQGPAAPERAMHDVDAEEVVQLAVATGLQPVRRCRAEDLMGRGSVFWDCLVFRAPAT